MGFSIDGETKIFLIWMFTVIFSVAAVKYIVKIICIQKRLNEVDREIMRCDGREKRMWINEHRRFRRALLPFARFR